MKDKKDDVKFIIWFKTQYPDSYKKFRKEFELDPNFELHLEWD